MAKHAESLKLELVRQYLRGSAGLRDLAERSGVGRTTLRAWVHRFQEHGDLGLARKRPAEYSAQFKLSVLRRIQDEALSRQQAAAIYNLRGGGGVVAVWQRQYDEGGLAGLEPKPKGRPRKMPKPPETPPVPPDDARTLEQLREENADLRAEVAYLKKLEALVRANRQAARKKRKPSSR